MNPSSKIEICPKHSNTPYITQCNDVANQLAFLLYGKRNYESIVGYHQNILVSKLKGKNIIINLPRNQTIYKNLKKSKSCTRKNNKGGRCSCSKCGGQIGQRNGPYHMDDTIIGCIKNDINKMVQHGIKRGLLITYQ